MDGDGHPIQELELMVRRTGEEQQIETTGDHKASDTGDEYPRRNSYAAAS